MKLCRPLLGTYVEIRVEGLGPARAMEVLHEGFDAIARVQTLMSVFDETSDVSRLNRLEAGQSLQVHAWTAEVLTLARRIHGASGGLFDCGVAPRLAQWGMLPTPLRLSEGTSSIAHLDIREDGLVHCRAPVRMDLGGIAKGYAVDKAAEALLAAGVGDGLVNAGGDLRAIGNREEAIYLRDPRNPQQLHHAGCLQDGAFATSGTYYSRRNSWGREVSALVNPLNGQALTTRSSYSVVAPLCAVADAFTKVLALSGDPGLPCFAEFSAQALILH